MNNNDFLLTACPAEIDNTPKPKAKISVIQLYGKVRIIFDPHINTKITAAILK